MSMTPMAVRIVLVEGADGDGVTLDSNVVDVSVGESGCSGTAEQVVAAILGTQESVDEGAHRLTAIGVAWADHADGKRLRQALRANDIDDVVMVSELHAASALAQAVGRRIGCERTALLFLEGSDATLAVVRTVDGAVVAVQSRAMDTEDIVADLESMVATLELSPEPPQAVFLMGAGLDVAALAARIAEVTTLPVHAPEDADLALARGAALAAAGTPRLEAETIVVPADAAGLGGRGESGPSDDTAAGATQVAAAGYMAPLGYSAVSDDDEADGDDYGDEGTDDDPAVWSKQPDPAEAADEKPFLLVGSTLATVFVVGVVALVVSLAVTIRPAGDQQPGDMRTSNGPTAAGKATDVEPSPSLETIEAPVPVVREAPRTAFVPAPAVRPQPQVPAAPLAPASVAPAAPTALPSAMPAAPAPAVTVPAAPAPAPVPAIPPIVLAPVIPVLPPFVQAPIRIPTLPVAPQVTAPMTTAPATTAPTTTVPTTTTPMTPSAGTTPTTVQGPTSVQTVPTEVSVPAQSTAVSVPSVSTEVSIPEVSVPTVTTEVLIPSSSGASSSGGDLGSGE